MEHTTMLGGNLWIWVIFIGFMILGWLVSHQLKSRLPNIQNSDRQRNDRTGCR